MLVYVIRKIIGVLWRLTKDDPEAQKVLREVSELLDYGKTED